MSRIVPFVSLITLIRPANTNKYRSIVDIEFFTKLIIMFCANGYYIPPIITENLSLDMTSTIYFILAVYDTTISFFLIATVFPVANPASATAVWTPASFLQILYNHLDIL
jgi:hypothetical protein